MIGHLDIRILKVVMDQVDLAIKELSLDAVLAPSPVSVNIGEPVVLVVKRPVVMISWWCLATSTSQLSPVFLTTVG